MATTLTAELVDRAGEYIEAIAVERNETICETRLAANKGDISDKAKAAAEIVYAWTYDGLIGDAIERFVKPDVA